MDSLWWLSIVVLMACGSSQKSSSCLWWQSISALMPVVVTAAKERPPGVHSVQVHREQASNRQSFEKHCLKVIEITSWAVFWE